MATNLRTKQLWSGLGFTSRSVTGAHCGASQLKVLGPYPIRNRLVRRRPQLFVHLVHALSVLLLSRKAA